MKEICLTRGQVALVDDDDFEKVSKYKWWAAKVINKEYISYYAHAQYKGKRLILHRVILGLDSDNNFYIDHINGDTLDNRQNNLRVCTSSQNQMNRRVQQHSSVYKGVFFLRNRKKWVATLTFNKKCIFIGYFDYEIDAAKSYNKKAIELFGEFAHLNKIEMGEI